MIDPTDGPVPPITSLVMRYPRLFGGEYPAVMSSVPKGWTALVDRLFDDLDVMLDDTQARAFTVIQIKEKYAELRVYWSLDAQQTLVVDLSDPQSSRRLDLVPGKTPPIYERISARIALAEAESARTCQRCGSPGSNASEGGWLVTLCEPCRELGRLAGYR